MEDAETNKTLNVVIELTLSILEIPASHLSPETGYPCCFPRFLQSNAWKDFKLSQDRFLPHLFQVIIYRPFIRHCIV
jgi:hypothetical protein